MIPAVNVDGIIKLKDVINDPEMKYSVRKNYNRTTCPDSTVAGVDLNRNYDDHFGLDSYGSSPDPCEE